MIETKTAIETEPKSFGMVRELSQRHNDKLEITLYWVSGTLDTYVELIDNKVNPPLKEIIEVPEGVSPDDVFHHPFYYSSGKSSE
jgi:hypothetical protein